VVTGLVTGWHAPGASHLALLAAVAGDALVERAYAEAVRHGYRWHEFGDSCLLLPLRTCRIPDTARRCYRRGPQR
jgi:S-adenosylmethionine:tRNA ribosyltransferase-isomerase